MYGCSFGWKVPVILFLSGVLSWYFLRFLGYSNTNMTSLIMFNRYMSGIFTFKFWAFHDRDVSSIFSFCMLNLVIHWRAAAGWFTQDDVRPYVFSFWRIFTCIGVSQHQRNLSDFGLHNKSVNFSLATIFFLLKKHNYFNMTLKTILEKHLS